MDKATLYVEFDGMMCQWIRKETLGLPITHNIVQLKRWYAAHPGGTIYLTFSTVTWGDLRWAFKRRIKQWCKDNEVIYTTVWTKPIPEGREHWKYLGER